MKKNVIILMIDGGRNDFAKKSEFYNNIKAKSVFLSQPVTYGPHTIAAMHAVFSGTFGNRTGVNSYWSTYNFKKENFKTLTEYMKDEKYYTCADIVNKLVIPKQGFDEFLIHDEMKDDLTKRHIEIIERMKEKNVEKQNFFLYLQYSNIHTTISEEVLKPFNNFSEEYFNNKEKNIERYQKLFTNSEKYLENILAKINELKLDENSIILIMSDHGISIGEKIGERAYGAFCYDYTIKPFAYFLTKEFPIKEIKKQVRTVDYFPTILEYLKIPFDTAYQKIDGESLFSAIFNDNLEEKIAFSETGNPQNDTRPPKEPNIHVVRTSEWKLIYNEFNETKELYNLIKDPHEENNLTNTNLDIEKDLWVLLQKILKN